MPPPEAAQPTDEQRLQLRQWVRDVLRKEAAARAGDPGNVPLRRLNNAEYTYSIRDLTGVSTLSPANEFPADGAAGEGFSNTGLALSMTPTLLEKYLAAAKSVAAHAVLTSDGVCFSPSTSRADWTNELLEQIRRFYRRYTEEGGGVAVNLQGIQFTTNQGGRLPLEKYFRAIRQSESALRAGELTTQQAATAHGLNPRYFTSLWQVLSSDADQGVLLTRLRAEWHSATSMQTDVFAEHVAQWQRALWRQNPVGHIVRHLGGTTGPVAWLEPVTPLVETQEIRVKFPAEPSAAVVTIHLAVLDAGDGNAQEYLVWDKPRIVLPGQPDLLLRDVPSVAAELAQRRQRIASTAAACLAAAAEVNSMPDEQQLTLLADRHQAPKNLLRAWLLSLGFQPATTTIDGHIRGRTERVEGYDFIQGWTGDNALSVLANSSDQHVRIPGNMRPHSVAVHPTPDRRVAVAWLSPVEGRIEVICQVQHAHPECGNGTSWSLEWRRGRLRRMLAAGVTQRETAIRSSPAEITVQKGDLVVLSIGPRDANHFCDLTGVELIIRNEEFHWSLSDDVAPNILAGNPHADRSGRPDVWHFFSEPDNSNHAWTIPDDSLLDRWLRAGDRTTKETLARQIQQLLEVGPDAVQAKPVDRLWCGQWMSSRGPLLSVLRQLDGVAPSEVVGQIDLGIPVSQFGRHPARKEAFQLDAASLCLASPDRMAIHLPAELVAGGELVATVHLDAGSDSTAAAQAYAGMEPPPPGQLVSSLPVIAKPDSPGWKRWVDNFERFRQLFPPALCYAQIVPVDEVITLNLFYREDDHLRRLMLTADEAEELDRLWQALWFVSQEPLQLAAAYQQLVEYATQDRPDKVAELTPLRPAVEARAQQFLQQQRLAEPRHLDWLTRWAARAYRRPLRDEEIARLKNYYTKLREENVEHDEAVRLLIARILTSPAFLYRMEESHPGVQPHPVSDFELATRLSYFLWSSIPDDALWADASQGRLHHPDVLRSHAVRMLQDEKIRRFVEEFAGHWLHVYEFDEHDEKSERHFPEFAELRSLMYEEFLQFFTHLFQKNGSVLDIVGADYTFVNDRLAAFYGIPAVEGPTWRQVHNAHQWARGGILTQAAILAKQSGASRTSPILRGAWISEVLLGEKLPKPPKNVPQLADTPPSGLTERQLIERHSQDPACARCHARIDPLGFALESYDAIGRHRQTDAHGLAIDTQTQLFDGTVLRGPDDLRRYILQTRRADFVRQFSRKLLGYALGRSVELADEPLLEELEQALAANDYRVWVAIEKIVLSEQFRRVRGRDFKETQYQQ